MSSAGAARVVVVEDDSAVRDSVARALRREGFEAVGLENPACADAVLAHAPDLAILDVMLPEVDGFMLGREIRSRRDVPIIFLTARDSVEDRVAGLTLGADDYLIKPFALSELVARVRTILRRAGRVAHTIEIEDLLIDESAHLVTRAGETLDVTPTELRLLTFFARHRGQVLSKDQLLTQVWGYDAYDPNLVEVHVSALRRKLERSAPRLIHTVRGIGYRFSP